MTRAKEHLVLSWSSTERARGNWPPLITAKLELPVDAPMNEPVVLGGVRLFTTDRTAPAASAGAAAAGASAIEILDRAAVACSPAGSATVTDVSRFHACPRKYYLSRYLGWQKTSRGLPDFEHDDADDDLDVADLNASELGRQVHAVLANQAEPDVPAVATELADRFRMSSLGKRSLRASRSAYEWDFVMEIAGLVLRGQIDLWFEQNRELVLVDYKTDREIDGEALEGYSLQLQLYAIALERFLGRTPDRAVLFMLRESREIEVDVTPLSLSAAMDAVHRFRDAQERQSFPLVINAHCGRCDYYRNLCPAALSASAQG
jgi:CRISPR/Cas system-associated exonuclease Cas4 (RecB family)